MATKAMMGIPGGSCGLVELSRVDQLPRVQVVAGGWKQRETEVFAYDARDAEESTPHRYSGASNDLSAGSVIPRPARWT
ncbi:hypothetical protein JMJ77_0014357 [Colletotrichum scovillei]|uniref:Uncharacterized protein n=1 Tax=Colletotrichum scovillei TaxID=1209932 RepID=A0A9P7R3A6_9PEZI|nr:hypothetical protein JMJ77_0014357 [Colletotrichum scovillei]KAG7065887.1 hypothetical protein JMJ78_0012631 [Colletotrichum scovillei]KAG7068458.1 hypothetical protein JMJ76_0008146 [Colletotrichum scovillei]